MLRGMFTPMGKNPQPKLSEEMQEIADNLQALMDLADALGWPKVWLTCDHCGQQAWRIPPHIFEPCPLMTDAMHAAGLKMDAERMQAVQAGVAVREQMSAFQQFLKEMRGREDEE